LKVVVGCPVAERAWVLPQWLAAIREQTIEVEIVCLLGDSKDDTEELLREAGVTLLETGAPTRSPERMLSHTWSQDEGEFRLMAQLRNLLCYYAHEELRADIFFSLDSDIILPSASAIELLLQALHDYAGNAVAPLVDMAAPLDLPVPKPPPAWNFMQWKLAGISAERAPHGPLAGMPFRAGVIMAAMMLDRTAQLVRWKDHPQGEDLGWSTDAFRHGVRLLVDPRVQCRHVMNYRY